MKEFKSLNDLAINGNKPAFEQPLYVGRPNLGNKEKFLSYVDEIYKRKWLTNHGPLVKEFERRICEFLGVKYCIAMCNGTVALEIAIRALELKGEVIIPSYTFIATAHALQWQEITPVFADINPYTHNIDPDSVRKMITPRTSGIIGVHLWGKPAPIYELTKIAKEYNLKLLFDAAHAFGNTYKGTKIGNFGKCEVFSFHATKIFNTFEGGAVVTNDDDLANKIRLMQNFGFLGFDNVIYIGTNGKMSEISAAMGLVNLDSFKEFVSVNKRNYELYRKYLNKIPGIRILNYDEKEENNYQYIIVEVDKTFPYSRDEIVSILNAENIIARKYFWPGCHRMEPYKSYYPHAGLLLPNTEEISSRVIILPNGTSIGEEEIMVISSIFKLLSKKRG